MTFVLVVGGLADLSVPATIACGAILSLALQPMIGPVPAFAAAIALAGLCGLMSGLLIGYIGINPIIATLGVGTIVLGIVQAAAGVRMLVEPGDEVRPGTPLAELHTDTPERLPDARAALAGRTPAVTDAPPPARDLVLEVRRAPGGPPDHDADPGAPRGAPGRVGRSGRWAGEPNVGA